MRASIYDSEAGGLNGYNKCTGDTTGRLGRDSLSFIFITIERKGIMSRVIEVRGVRIGDGIPKICIPVMGGRVEEILDEAKKASMADPDMVEWRIDTMEEPEDENAVRDALRGLRGIFSAIPLVATFRSAREGGGYPCGQEVYERICLSVIELGEADLIDVEYFAGEGTVKRLIRTAHEAGMGVILSSHDFSCTPREEELLSRLAAMEAAEGDILKLAVMPKNAADVTALLHVTALSAGLRGEEKMEKPLITMSMGSLGSISRVCGELTGSAVTFGCVSKASAPGQMEAAQLRRELLAFHDRLGCGRGLPWKENLFLIGFMGTGKSTVAHALARKYGMQAMEMDEEIVREEGMPVTEIFETKGEEYFRALETDLLMRLCSRRGLLVSCGGGVAMREENVEWMRRSGKVILLTASPATVLKRVKDGVARPLLNGHMDEDYIRQLMEKRREYYEEAADCAVSTDDRAVDEIVEEICRYMTESSKR